MNNVYFLVKYDSAIGNYDFDSEDEYGLVNYLKGEGFSCMAGYYGCPWYFIDINEKIYKPGRPGVKYGKVIGNHAITFYEFVQIYEMYKKYKGKKLLDMSIEESPARKITFDDYLKQIAIGTYGQPIALGLHLATSGKVPMSEELKEYLKECYENNISPSDAAQGWI